MARYIDAVELVKAIEENQRNTEHHCDGRGKQIHVNEHRHFIKMVYEQPTADVTPRMEYERLAQELERVEALYFQKVGLLQNAKREAARDIIADMYEQIKGYENIDVILCRIKEKYTEGNDANS